MRGTQPKFGDIGQEDSSTDDGTRHKVTFMVIDPTQIIYIHDTDPHDQSLVGQVWPSNTRTDKVEWLLKTGKGPKTA